MAERKPTKAAADDAGIDKPAEPSAVENPQAAPIEAPAERPKRDISGSSTNPVSAAAALRSPPGADHVRLLDDDGNDISPDELFDFPDKGSPATVATVRRRVRQEFLPPNASTKVQQLLYAEGTRVPVAHALQVQAEMRAAGDKPA